MGSGPTVRAWNPLPGDPAGLHETGRISPAFADGRVAARAAASSAVGVGVVGALSLPAPTQASQQQQPGETGVLRAGGTLRVLEASPGVVLPVVGGLAALAGSSFPGGRARRRASAAQRAAAMAGVRLAARLLLLPAGCVRVAPRGCRGAAVVRLHPTGAVVAFGGVATFCPAAAAVKQQQGENKAQKGFFFFEGQSQDCLVPLRQLQDQRGCAYFL